MTQQEYSDYVTALYLCYYNPHTDMIEQANFPFTYLLHNAKSFFNSNYQFDRNGLLASIEQLCEDGYMIKHDVEIGEVYSITPKYVELMRMNGYK